MGIFTVTVSKPLKRMSASGPSPSVWPVPANRIIADVIVES